MIFSREFFFNPHKIYSLKYTRLFENLKARILKSIITWSVMGQRNSQAKKVYYTTDIVVYIFLLSSFGKRTHHGVPGERQCAYPFDGPGKVLAHAYFPTNGRIHFDNEEWYTESGKTTGWW